MAMYDDNDGNNGKAHRSHHPDQKQTSDLLGNKITHISFRLSKSSLMLKLKTFMPPTISRTLARAYQGRKLYRDMNSFFLKFGKFDLFFHNQLSDKM